MAKRTKKEKCWICGMSNPKPAATILVGYNKAGEKEYKEKKVRVHFGCYMGMDICCTEKDI